MRDDQWERIAPLLQSKPSDAGRRGADNRLFIDAVLWVARTGRPWRDVPVEFGTWNSSYVRFSRWSDKQVWQKVFGVLREDADFEEVFLDSTIVRAHQHAASAAKKKHAGDWTFSGGLTTKIHACVEGFGQLATCRLIGGQANDITQADALLQELKPTAVLADKAYDADALVHSIETMNAKAVTPPRFSRKVQRSFDRSQYHNRNVIERFFAHYSGDCATEFMQKPFPLDIAYAHPAGVHVDGMSDPSGSSLRLIPAGAGNTWV